MDITNMMSGEIKYQTVKHRTSEPSFEGVIC